MRMASRCLSLLMLLIISLTDALFAGSDNKAPAERPAPKPPTRADWKPSQQEVFVPYWTLEPGWDTQLEIRNNLGWHDLDVTPVLRTAGGTEIALPPVTVAPDQIVAVDLRQAIVGRAPQLLDKPESFGSVIYRFSALDSGNVLAA